MSGDGQHQQGPQGPGQGQDGAPAYGSPPPPDPPYGPLHGGQAPSYAPPPAAPPPVPPPYGQEPPPYGQQPYGQAPYGQAPYGQVPYGQPSYPPEPGAPPPYGVQSPPGHGPAPGYGPPPGPGLPPGIRVADFGRRAAARLIDGAIVTAAVVALFVVVVAVIGSTAGFSEGATSEGDDVAAGLSVLAFLAFLFLGLPAYEIVCVARWGATPGKRLTGIRVVRIDPYGTVRPAGWGASILRWVLPWAASLLVPVAGSLLVYLSPLFDSSGRLQGWHDKVAGTYVVHG